MFNFNDLIGLPTRHLVLRAVFWALILLGLLLYTPEIGTALHGLVDRIDYLIGYEETAK